jgi:uncharacterized Rossmann fold enzyme
VREIDLSFWMPIYFKIAERLKLDVEEDRRATRVMDSLMIGKKDLSEELEDLIKGEDVLVVGNGPSLNRGFDFDGIVITADAASLKYLKLFGREPEVIVSDLDGPPEILSMRSIKVLHAHGDNIGRILEFVPRVEELVATTQVEPTERVHNFGGFTDGDRSVFLACICGAKSIRLAGMDFDSVSEYDIAAGKDIRRKMEKLKIARELLKLSIEIGCPLEVGGWS